MDLVKRNSIKALSLPVPHKALKLHLVLLFYSFLLSFFSLSLSLLLFPLVHGTRFKGTVCPVQFAKEEITLTNIRMMQINDGRGNAKA